MLAREATEDANPRLYQIRSGITGRWKSLDPGAEQIEGSHAERNHETILRPEQTVDGAGGGAHLASHAADRERLQPLRRNQVFGRIQEGEGGAIVVFSRSSHCLTAYRYDVTLHRIIKTHNASTRRIS